MTNFIWHSDPSHAWLEVTRKHLKVLGIENKVSEYSYQFGDRIYLEEDCDAPLFFKAADSAGFTVNSLAISEMHTDTESEVRSYESYSND
jgi:hypothetical protein